jgi:hypothetical protein
MLLYFSVNQFVLVKSMDNKYFLLAFEEAYSLIYWVFV